MAVYKYLWTHILVNYIKLEIYPLFDTIETIKNQTSWVGFWMINFKTGLTTDLSNSQPEENAWRLKKFAWKLFPLIVSSRKSFDYAIIW